MRDTRFAMNKNPFDFVFYYLHEIHDLSSLFVFKEAVSELRQVYRWLKALEEEKLIEKFDRFPARYRLKPVGSKLR
jgi:hypothetical protein